MKNASTHTIASSALLTIKQVASHLQVSDRQVRRWIANGALPFVQFGPHAIRIAENDLALFIAKARTSKHCPLTSQNDNDKSTNNNNV